CAAIADPHVALGTRRSDGPRELLARDVRHRLVAVQALGPFAGAGHREVALEHAQRVVAEAPPLPPSASAEALVQLGRDVLDLDRAHSMKLACISHDIGMLKRAALGARRAPAPTPARAPRASCPARA